MESTIQDCLVSDSSPSRLSLSLPSGARGLMGRRKARERDFLLFSLPITPCSRRARFAETTGDKSGLELPYTGRFINGWIWVHIWFIWSVRNILNFRNCAELYLRSPKTSLDKGTNELAMVVKDIPALRDSFEPWFDEVWWKFAWTEIKNSSVKKFKSEQFRTWNDLDRETIFVYSIINFWVRLVAFLWIWIRSNCKIRS